MLVHDIFASCQILVVGDLALDRYVYGDIGRISPEGPVPVLRVRSVRSSPGCAANVAVNIASLGGHAIVVGVVGDDREADYLADSVRERSNAVRLCFVKDPSRPTTVKTRYVAAGQQVVRADIEEISAISGSIEKKLIAEYSAMLEACNAVIISDYNKGALTDRVLKKVIASARAAGKPVLVDPKRKRLEDYRGATLLKPNKAELRVSTARACDTDEEARLAAEKAIKATGAMILLTRSEQGMSLFRAGADPVHQRAEAREVFDVSGAGDTVAAVLGLALGLGIDMVDAMRIANAAAGIVVGKRGTATVTTSELMRQLSLSRHGFEDRIVARETAALQREEWRRQGLTVGFTNGCFDLIHPGHISLLRQARKTCDRLIVALNSDDSVRRLKGPTRPLQTEHARAYVMAAIEHVDLVTLFNEDTPLELIAALKPDVLVKGADYTEDQVVGADIVKSWGGKVFLANLVPEQSTTRLVSRSGEQRVLKAV